MLVVVVVMVVVLGTQVEWELGKKLENPGGGLLMGGTRPGGGGGGGGVPFKSTTVLKPGEEASWVDKGLRELESLPVVWGRGGDLGALEGLEVPLGYSKPGLSPLNVH